MKNLPRKIGLLALICAWQINVSANETPVGNLATIPVINSIWPAIGGPEAPNVTVSASPTYASSYSGMSFTTVTVDYAEPGRFQLWFTGRQQGALNGNDTFLYRETTDNLSWSYNVISYDNYRSTWPYVTQHYYAILGNYEVSEFFITRSPVAPIINTVPEAGYSAALLAIGALGLGVAKKRKMA